MKNERFSEYQIIGILRSVTKFGSFTIISLENRACIALGQKMELPIYTANKELENQKSENLQVRIIYP